MHRELLHLVRRAIADLAKGVGAPAPQRRAGPHGADVTSTDRHAPDASEGAARQTDEAWEVPLCEAWGPHNATTAAQPECRGMAGEALLALYERLASYARRPVRGKPRPPDEVSTLASRGPPPRSPPRKSGKQGRSAVWN